MTDAAVATIERWWPHLDIEHKHAILANLDAPLSAAVLEAVTRLCGESFAVHPVLLTAAEKGYIVTQMEPVD